jgi:uncharacterized protein
MVGLSSNYYNASSFAGIYLDANGYDIVPVNPVQAGKQILGRRVYANLSDAAASHPRPIEIVDVFRPSHEVPEIAEQAVKIGAKVLWLQLGVVNYEAARVAHEAGLAVVMDRCCKIEHARFFGGLRTIGLNTGIVTASWRCDFQKAECRTPPHKSRRSWCHEHAAAVHAGRQ